MPSENFMNYGTYLCIFAYISHYSDIILKVLLYLPFRLKRVYNIRMIETIHDVWMYILQFLWDIQSDSVIYMRVFSVCHYQQHMDQEKIPSSLLWS